ncbi:MAG: GTPase [Verrucomicrobiota bacterium]
MPHANDVKIHAAAAGSARVLDQLRRALKESSSSQVRNLIKELPSGLGDDGKPVVSIALVGQYDAGKSRIIRALTGRKDIKVDADVCTTETTVYDWSGIRLVDTPGLRAGYAEHDAITEKQITDSDLVLFVITDELFPPSIGEYFRDLAFGKHRAGEIMLLVNKIDQSPGGPEVKRPDIERVTSPLNCEEFRTRFISAKLYEEALVEPDESDRRHLMEKSGFNAFTSGLNDFVEVLGLESRLTTPLYQMHGVAMSASALTGVEDEGERAAVTLLIRRLRLIDESRQRLRRTVTSLLEKCFDAIAMLGEALASAIDPEAPSQDLEGKARENEGKAKEVVTRLQGDVTKAIADEQRRLKAELEELDKSGLAANLRSSLEARESQIGSAGPLVNVGRAKIPGGEGSDAVRKVKVLSSISKNMSDFLIPFTQGARVASKYGSLMASGSKAHQMVLKAGELFGKSFKPWEAAGIAAKLGKFARILGPVGAALQVIVQIMDDRAAEKEQAQLRDGRNETRALYVDTAQAIRAQFLSTYEKFEKEQYDPIRMNTEDQINALRTAETKRGEETQTFKQLADQAMQLIDRIHADKQ